MSDLNQKNAFKYRRDIDGLRAIAVLSVLLYHAFPLVMPGGFIGVDIFFVISGFLISTLIFEQLSEERFSFLVFYSRRIKRIFPALIMVLMVSLIIGWFVLLADEYKQLGKHVAGGAAFISNFILWGESGYFDNAASTKPLLHLWSLGIEEQFYIIWPLLSWYAFKRKFNLTYLASIVALVSFSLNIIFIHIDAVATFYSPQTRFWELMIGAIIAYLSFKKNQSQPNTFQLKTVFFHSLLCRNILSVIGMMLVFLSFFVIKDGNAFPGWWGLLPAVGTAFIIIAGAETFINKKILSSAVLVWFGLISYPLYLWHWPLLSFAHIVDLPIAHVPLKIVCLLLAILLSSLTYRFVEKPIRNGKHDKFKTIMLIVLMVLVGSFGFWTDHAKGFPDRKINAAVAFNSDQLNWEGTETEECDNAIGGRAQYCLIYGNKNNIKVAILGDSTANSLAPGLGKLYGNEKDGVIDIGAGMCPPIRGLMNQTAGAAWTDPCVTTMDRAYAYVLKDPHIKVVILSIFARDVQNWIVPGFPKDMPNHDKFQFIKKLLDNDIADLQKAGKKVVLSYDAPYFPYDPRECISRSLFRKPEKNCKVQESALIDRNYIDYFAKSYADRKDVCIFNQSPLTNYQGAIFSMMDSHGKLLLRDDHHLSFYGSEKMAYLISQSGCMENENNL